MEYTSKQIENAKRNYNAMLSFHTLANYDVANIGLNTAEQRCEYHNSIVRRILNGDIELANEWKRFFLKEEVLRDQKINESKQKLTANKEASSDLLAQIKNSGKLLGDYYKFVKSNKTYAREFFSKKFTQTSVTAFLSL